MMCNQNIFDGMQPSLPHWGQVMYICIGNPTIIVPDNGLLPVGHQVIIWTNARILLIRPLEINLSEIFKPNSHIFSSEN